MSVETPGYRKRLYDQYVSTHLSSIRSISRESFERQRVAYRAYFGRHLPKAKDARILDMGCGYGCLLYHLQQEGYESATGVDVSPEQIALAQQLGVRNVECADLIDHLERHTGCFDCIVALDVVEHFRKEEILPLLDLVFSALRPNGVFIMQSPNSDGPFAARHRYFDFSHEVAFTASSAGQVLSAAGFQSVTAFGCEPVVHGIMSLGRFLVWKAAKLFLKVYLASETGSFRGYLLTQNLIAVARKG